MTKYAVVDLEATSASHTSKIIQIGIVVVENGKKAIGEQVTVLVTSVLQTSAGRMNFARLKPEE